MSWEVQEQLRGEIGPNERLVWSGQPLPGVRFTASDAFIIPFSVVWGGFAFYWEYSVWHIGAPLVFRLWGIPFVLIGIHITVGRFFTDAMTRAKTVYALTDQRAVIIVSFLGHRVRSVDLAATPEIALSGHTITLGRANRGRNQQRPPQFEFLPDARVVYEQIIALQANARNAA
jgi:hypothetical protein